MSKELEEIQKRMNAEDHFLDCDINFEEYSKLYAHTNENLKDYISNLSGKRVLTVSASGEHLLNAVLAGATEVDTFDINRYSPLFQELKIYAIRYLKPAEAYIFLCLFDKDLYRKFSKHLPQHIKEFFDYLFDNYPYETIIYKLFDEFSTSLENNNFNSLSGLQELKERLMKVKRQHFASTLYDLPSCLKGKYDVIYLSNILDYEKNYTKYFYIVRKLKEFYLNEGGELYYNYLWGKPADIPVEKCYKAHGSNKYISEKDIEANRDIINSTDKIIVRSTYERLFDFKDRSVAPDIILRTRKER